MAMNNVQVDAASVFGASVQLPMFDKAEPDAWLILAEANFNLWKVTDSNTKYWYVLSKFDASTFRKLSTFLKSPREDDPYGELRRMLCRMYEPPLAQKIDALLALTDAGDERPSEFVLELRRLEADASVEDFIKRIFVRCQSQEIRTAIASSLGGKLDTIVEVADRAWTDARALATNAMVAAVSGPPSSQARKGARGGRQRGFRPQAMGQTTALNLCSYHKKFGDSAKKCVPACSRWGDHRSRESQAQVFHVQEALDGEDELLGAAPAPGNG